MSLPDGNDESPDAARLTEVVYYSSAEFFLLQARQPEHVPVQRGSVLSAQDSCGLGTSRFTNLALTDTQSEVEPIGRLWRFPIIPVNSSRSGRFPVPMRIVPVDL